MNLDWSLLKKLSNIKMVRLSAIWIFLVPLLIKFLYIIDISKYSNLLALPDIFIVLYSTGVSFFFAGIIFTVFCPNFIFDFSNYNDFKSKGYTILSINYYLKKLNMNDTNTLKSNLEALLQKVTSADIDNNKALPIEIGKEKLILNINKSDERELYWIIYDFLLNKNKVSFSFSLVFYLIGFILLLYVFISNLVVVLKSLY